MVSYSLGVQCSRCLQVWILWIFKLSYSGILGHKHKRESDLNISYRICFCRVYCWHSSVPIWGCQNLGANTVRFYKGFLRSSCRDIGFRRISLADCLEWATTTIPFTSLPSALPLLQWSTLHLTTSWACLFPMLKLIIHWYTFHVTISSPLSMSDNPQTWFFISLSKKKQCKNADAKTCSLLWSYQPSRLVFYWWSKKKW